MDKNFREVIGPKNSLLWISSETKGYILHKKLPDVIYVKCYLYSVCSGTASIRKNQLKSQHSHSCVTTDADLDLIRCKWEMKYQATQSTMSTRNIYNQVIATALPETKANLTFPKIVGQIKYHRNAAFPPNPGNALEALEALENANHSFGSVYKGSATVDGDIAIFFASDKCLQIVRGMYFLNKVIFLWSCSNPNLYLFPILTSVFTHLELDYYKVKK